jgi:hypothetical protein
MEKLVDIVHFLHVEIQDTFGPCGKLIRSFFLPLNQPSLPPNTIGLSVMCFLFL